MFDCGMLKMFSDAGIGIGAVVSLFGLVWFFVRWMKTTTTKLGARLDEAHDSHLKDMRSVVVNNTIAMTGLTAAISRCPLQGREGPQGLRGVHGDTGDTGERGERGERGEKGD